MREVQTSSSEVAHLLHQVQAEYEAARRGLSGLASGTARHAFIQARMNCVGQRSLQLQKIVGGQQAIALIAQELERCPNGTHPSQE